MKTMDPDLDLHHDGELDGAPDALDRLLAQARVPVREGFTRQVMSALRTDGAARRGRARWEWAAAAGVAAALVAIAAVLLAGADTGSSVATSVLDLLAATLAAGAGFLAASWRGLGAAIGAALDGSVTAIAGLGLAALGALELKLSDEAIAPATAAHY
jgi:hypothetical protein